MKKRFIPELILLIILVCCIPFAYAAGIAISQLTAITGDAAAYNDVLSIVDVSDTAQSANGSIRKIAFEDLTKTLVSVDANGMSAGEMAAVGSSGAVFYATGAGTWNLPACEVGMNILVYSTTANAVVINPDNADTILPTTNAAGDSITSASAAGDYVCLHGYDATTWYVLGRSGTWTDSN